MTTAMLVLVYAGFASDPWADAVVDFSPSLDGRGLYNDPVAALGEPTRTFIDPFSGEPFRASVVVAPLNRDESGRKTLLTLRRGEFVKVRFDEPVEDDPRNPFGIDLLVFGNAFFVADAGIDPETNMDGVMILGGAYREPVIVAVSPTGEGNPESHPEAWHVFSGGPYGDDLFPTNAFLWDSCAHAWGSPSDYTRPVDPALTEADFIGLSAGEGITLYRGSGGGAGFDLAATPFASVQYVYLTSESLGEVDALADVAPGHEGVGDVDFDGDTDLADFARVQRCFSGGGGVIEGCDCRGADLDGDGDIDLEDYRRVHEGWSGPR
ncbi:MAG: hypothetical protein FLDDKLPJ_03752 [Phycisphaerae bacterium]|nr:hypothetical protein [Phycisphaerae bacterium]